MSWGKFVKMLRKFSPFFEVSYLQEKLLVYSVTKCYFLLNQSQGWLLIEKSNDNLPLTVSSTQTSVADSEKLEEQVSNPTLCSEDVFLELLATPELLLGHLDDTIPLQPCHMLWSELARLSSEPKPQSLVSFPLQNSLPKKSSEILQWN